MAAITDHQNLKTEDSGKPAASPVQPLVSVLMLTYNHASFLEQAVLSVAGQKCAFPFELVIGDDCSTDNTAELAYALQKRFPSLIRVLAATHNLGITPNFQRLADACQGKYIAMLEGDDYWIDEDKLQSQFDLMESDDSLALCAGKTQNRVFWGDVKPRYGLAELLRRYLVHTSTLFFRKIDVPDFIGCQSVHALDSLLIAFLAEKGDCGFIDRELSYYRRHGDGAWTGKKQQQQVVLTHQLTDFLSGHFAGQYQRELDERELWIYSMMCKIDPEKGFFSQWFENLSLVRLVLARNFFSLPLSSGWFILSVVTQPFTSSVTVLRYRLGLGSRVRSLISGKNTI